MFVNKFVVLAVIIFETHANFENYDYCKLDCTNGWNNNKIKHVVCQRRDVNCGPAPICKKYENIQITSELRRAIIDKHNILRNKVALGKETKGKNAPQPKAANMNALSYNTELEYIAQCWSNTCQMDAHSQCMRTESMPHVGQNMAIRSYSWPGGVKDVKENVEKMIQSWYDEVTFFDAKTVPSFVFSSSYGHYTEMIWGKIKYIGCGISTYYRNNWYPILMVCNYGSEETSGNLLTAPIYQTGKPQSACARNMQPSRKYDGLCGADIFDIQEKSVNYEREFNDNVSDTTNPTTVTPKYIKEISYFDEDNNSTGKEMGNVQLMLFLTFWTFITFAIFK